MAKYMVLFTKESIDAEDDSIDIGDGMLFGYSEEKAPYWTFDSAEAAHKEAKANDYEPGTDYIVVRVLK